MAANATEHIRAFGATSPGAAADAAQAAVDTLHVAAAMLRNRTLREAAGFYKRAAREPFGRIPLPTKAGNQLRQAARIMATYAHLGGDHTNEWAIVIVRLAALAEAVAELRDAQQRAAQARAALAAQQLHAVRFAPPSRPPGPPRARNAVGLAARSFTGPPVPSRSLRTATGQPSADEAPRPTRRPTQPRPRGPSRYSWSSSVRTCTWRVPNLYLVCTSPGKTALNSENRPITVVSQYVAHALGRRLRAALRVGATIRCHRLMGTLRA